ncbi:ABC transporter substrate-binding protein [Agrococcus jejuensis]|uniref:Peptide/nickel transport system substrate-binding protein n=1 Tax=Agrococcus jejuensis TaxID=399736 RepID=A0A1G8DV88_9MICO|nr:ABC transporter substrate-binding protein [Agrococcus jejuensis]SDH61525.1 peptide/nickel transport system substrate-binding protein [Agrococcus jejuensis]
MKSTALKAGAVGVAATLALAGCGGGGGGGGAADPSGATLSIGMTNDVMDWDPGQAHVGHLLQPYQAAYDTLILREPDGEYSPMLATEWEYDDTNTVLTMSLRDDVTFSDGEQFDADAVVANLEHFQADNGRQAAQLRSFAGAEAIDATTVEITLTQADPAFEYFLSQAAGLMGSPAALDGDEIGAVPVGSGPYVMDTAATQAGSQYVFTPREDYWNPDLQLFSSITFRPLVDVTARVNALASGQVDATIVNAPSVAQLEGSGFTLVAQPVDWSGLLLFDRDGSMVPALGDVRVRQAINYAVDRQTLLDAVQLGYGETTAQPFGPTTGAFDEELEDAYPYDPERARELLAEAGYSSGVTIQVPSVGQFESYIAALRQQLGDVGITLEPVPIPDQELVTEISSGDYPVGLFQMFQGEPWVAIQQIISTDALYNSRDSMTPELQALIDAVQAAPTPEESDAAAQEVNRYVVENAWFVPVFRPDQLYFVDADITVEPQIQMAVPSIYNFAPAS